MARTVQEFNNDLLAAKRDNEELDWECFKAKKQGTIKSTDINTNAIVIMSEISESDICFKDARTISSKEFHYRFATP